MYRFVVLQLIIFGWVQTTPDNDTTASMHFRWTSLKYSTAPGTTVEPFDVDLDFHNRMFVTTPRIRPGVSVTLGYISDTIFADGSALIIPYPNLEMNTNHGKCHHIHNVYRIKVDECNRLWVLDTGIQNNTIYCAPKLLVFDLLNDQLISNHTFDKSMIEYDYTQFIAPIVDIRNEECDDAFVYIADVYSVQIVVYNHKNKKSWLVRSQHFHQSPEFGVNYDFIVDDFELTLGPVRGDGDRKLFFHELESGRHGYVMTSLIRNSTRFQEKPNVEFDDIVILPYERPRSGTEVMNKDGILFYNSGYDNSIKCWTLETGDGFNHDMSDTVLKDMGIATNIKIVNFFGKYEMILVNSISASEKINEPTPPGQITFQINGGFVNYLILGTNCGPISGQQGVDKY